jgi:hypothetical protein
MKLATYGTVTIASGKGVSDAELLSGRAVIRISTPGDWVIASAPLIGILVSEDGTTYKPAKYFATATPTTAKNAVITVATGASYAIPSNWTDGAYSVKLYTGTVATSTPIEHAHVFGLTYRLV